MFYLVKRKITTKYLGKPGNQRPPGQDHPHHGKHHLSYNVVDVDHCPILFRGVATLSFIVLTFAKAMRNFCDQFPPITNEKRDGDDILIAAPPTKTMKIARAASMASAKDDHCHTSQETSGCDATSPCNKAFLNCVSGHSLTPSPSQKENNACHHPPDLFDEDDKGKPRTTS